MKKIFPLLFLFIQYFTLQAQVSTTYHWYKFTSAFVPISGSRTTLDEGVNINDSLYVNMPIGFTFNFNGIDYTTMGVSSNGFIWFGTTSPSPTEYDPISSNAGCDGIVAVFGSDLKAKDNTSAINLKTTGSVPHRICTVEWLKFGKQTSMGDYQVKLYEDSNFIECHYNHAPYFIDDSFTGQVGLRGDNNQDFNNRSIICGAGVSWDASQPGTSNTALCEINGKNCGLGLYPHQSTSYKWSTYLLGIAGIDQRQLTDDSKLFSVSSNPGQGSFEVMLNDRYKQVQIKIFNCLGQEVFFREVNEPVGRVPVALGTYGKGFYLVRVSEGSMVSSKKILVE